MQSVPKHWYFLKCLCVVYRLHGSVLNIAQTHPPQSRHQLGRKKCEGCLRRLHQCHPFGSVVVWWRDICGMHLLGKMRIWRNEMAENANKWCWIVVDCARPSSSFNGLLWFLVCTRIICWLVIFELSKRDKTFAIKRVNAEPQSSFQLENYIRVYDSRSKQYPLYAEINCSIHKSMLHQPRHIGFRTAYRVNNRQLVAIDRKTLNKNLQYLSNGIVHILAIRYIIRGDCLLSGFHRL